ncbi:uncharacterized protein LOC133359537 isoform X2 [Lethenteron reissneri]|uniref:uncharacterized protein LOC133359537 isoform X2 n=1 Tax=Lethenteron reissneri TaxID=7753 RepID=UPI002AB7757C|nr:uncharacterized protein LOC133359537 isoform X2 [Lethenteron reissneri]
MSSFVEIRTEDAHRIIIIMIRRRGSWWLEAMVVSERGKMLAAVLALCCCVRLVAATPTEAPCPHGFHRVVETGLCCELCKPGQFVLFECMENKGPSICGKCPNGYYTAVANYLLGCLKCKPCKQDEEFVQPCNGSSATLCRCKAGLHKADDGLCVQGGGKTAGIVVAVILLLFVAAAVAAFIYKKKGGRFPCEGEPGNSNQQESTAFSLLKEKPPIPETGPCAVVRDMDESMAAKLIRGKRPELKKWIGRDPTYLLDYLDSKELISRDKYHGARNIMVKVERANFLIDEFIDRDDCLTLWRALESIQDHYPQVEEWISACASTMPHTCVVRDMDESMAAKLIRGKRPELRKWIGRNPTYLLDYLDSRDLISRDKYNEAKDIMVKVERAKFLIDEFIDRNDCLTLWRALESLQYNYPQVEEWISTCASTKPHTCDGKPGHSSQPDSTALDQDEQQITQIDPKRHTRVPVITDKELLQIHQTLRDNGFIWDYPHVMRLAGLAESFISEASENHGQNVNERNYAMLRHWRESLGRRATYGRLAETLDKAGFSGTAEMVMKLCDGFARREEEEEWREEEVQDIYIDS